MDWAATAISELWRHAWAVVPVAGGAVLLTRVMPLRPVTRHGLWVVVLLWFIAPLLLPKPPEDSLARVSALAERAADELAKAAQPDQPTHLITVRPVGIPAAPARHGDPIPEHDAPPERPSFTNASFPHVEVPATSASPTVRPQRRRPPPLPLASRSGGPGYFKPIAMDTALETCPLPAPDGQPERVIAPAPAWTARPVQAPPAARPQPAKPTRTASPPPASAPVARHDAHVVPDVPVVAQVPTSEPTPAAEPVEATTTERPSAVAMWLTGFQSVRTTLSQLPAMPGRIWIGGAVLIAVWHVVGLIWFVVRMRRSRPAPRWVVREVRRVAHRCGLQRVPEVRMIDACISPLVLTGLRPRMYLPVHLWDQLDRIGRRAILCHELAHLRRGDDWIRWGELVISTICWWHPLVWWVRGRIHEEADLSCDSWVTWLMPGERRAYAEALLRTKAYVSSGGGSMPAVGLGATSVGARKFARRLTMVMTKTNRPGSSLSGGVLLASLMAVGWATLPAFSCPPDDCETTAPKVRVAPTATIPSAPQAPRLLVVKPPAPPTPGTPARFGATVRPPAPPTATFAPRPMTAAVPRTPRFAAPPQPALLLASAGDDTADRVRALERQLREMQNELRQLARGLNRQEARPAPSSWPFRAQGPSASPGDSDEVIIRKYELSKGRLEALTELMIRQDVPVLVQPMDDGIEVHAIERHHRIFRAFVDMIEGREKPGSGPSWAPGARATQDAERLLANRERAEMAERLAVARARGAEARDLHDARRELHDQMHALSREAANIFDQAAALQAEAEILHDKADDDRQKESTRKKLYRQAEEAERKAEVLERKAESIERKAEHLERRAEELEAEAEHAHEHEHEHEHEDQAAWLREYNEAEPVVAVALRDAVDQIRDGSAPEVREALLDVLAQKDDLFDHVIESLDDAAEYLADEHE